VGAYWKNAGGHEEDYQPFVLVNDVVRYWRILLLNYVAKNKEKEQELEEPKRDAERRLRSYKLRFSRAMTCFSALAALLAKTAVGGVKQEHVLSIVKQRPVERLEAARTDKTDKDVSKLLMLYEKFQTTTDRPKGELVESYREPTFAAERAKEGREFGDALFDLLQALGRDDRAKELFRYMVV
jgi:hypothetical protein